MLERLSVRNYVLIDNLDLEFSPGFSVITGETGSGKSIILGALSLLLGAKADKEAVRNGAESAEISGVFRSSHPEVLSFLSSEGIETEDGEIIIRRSIKINGRSSYSVNGTPVTRKEGEALGHMLVDISSQHAHQSLLRPEVQRALLDRAADDKILLDEYRAFYTALAGKEKEKARLEEMMRSSAEENDYMEFCLRELDEADLAPGEDDELQSKLAIMNSSELIREALSLSQDELKGAASALNDALSAMRKAEKKDPRLSGLSSRTEVLSIECEDIALSVRDHLHSIEFSEEELERMNSRLAQLQRIKRRFGPGIEDAIRKRDEYRRKLDIAGNGEELLLACAKEIEALRERMIAAADALTAARRKAAAELSRAIKGNLSRLGMSAAEFIIDVSPTEPSLSGQDEISFMIAPNKGEKLSYVNAIASGGELSRIMLSMKSALSAGSDIDIFIFDEIDAGIGGAVANAVGEELLSLSRESQVIAITHLPQIAVRASSHYLVYKEEEGDRTISRIRRIEGEERVEETARLLSGNTSGISIEHARRLLEVQG